MGTAFACLLRDNGHEVTLAARDPEQVAAIVATSRNPRYAHEADLRGIAAAEIVDAPVASADLVVVAVPSRVFGVVVAGLPGNTPILSLTKGLDPATASDFRRSSRGALLRCSPARTSPRRSRVVCRLRP